MTGEVVHNTGNPVPSADAYDRHDNTRVFDGLLNGSDLTVTGRTGKILKSWAGVEKQVTDYLIAQSYESVYLTYSAGVVVQRQTQLIQRAGELYRVMNAADIPLTLTGTWATDAPKLQAVGDAALRQALALLSGAGKVGFDQTEAYAAATVGFELKFPEGERGGNLGASIKLGMKNLGAVGRTGVFSTDAMGFNTRFGPISFIKKGSGNATIISSLDKYKPPGAFATPENYAALGLTAYFVTQNGNDASAGTSWAAALSSVAVALQKSNVDVVFVLAGNYFAGKHMGNYTGTRNVSIQAVGGPVNFISGPVSNTTPTWVATGLTGVYKQSNSDTFLTGVVALNYQDSAGNPFTLLPAADVNAVGATPGSWFRSATELFISLPGLDAPTANIFYYQSAPMRVTGGSKKVHLRGINFIGGTGGAFSVRGGDGNLSVYGEDIGCCGQPANDGWQMKNMGISIAVRCRASRNGNDGFNYHAPDGVGSVEPHFIEIDCIATESRAAGTGNGSSSHETCRGIRVNCHYYANGGPGIADVNDAQTYNVGCTSRKNGPSVSAFGAVASSDEKTGLGVRMFLDGCVFDSNAGEDVRCQNGSAIFYRDVWASRDRISVDGTSSASPFS